MITTGSGRKDIRSAFAQPKSASGRPWLQATAAGRRGPLRLGGISDRPAKKSGGFTNVSPIAKTQFVAAEGQIDEDAIELVAAIELRR